MAGDRVFQLGPCRKELLPWTLGEQDCGFRKECMWVWVCSTHLRAIVRVGANACSCVCMWKPKVGAGNHSPLLVH